MERVIVEVNEELDPLAVDQGLAPSAFRSRGACLLFY